MTSDASLGWAKVRTHVSVPSPVDGDSCAQASVGSKVAPGLFLEYPVSSRGLWLPASNGEVLTEQCGEGLGGGGLASGQGWLKGSAPSDLLLLSPRIIVIYSPASLQQ